MLANNKLLRILSAILLLGVVIAYRAYLIEYIIEPIALLLWLLWRIIASIDQKIYWLVLIIIIGVMVLRINSGWRRKTENKKYRYAYRLPSRLAHWQSLVEVGISSRAGEEELRNGLRDLVVDILIQREKGDQENPQGQTEKRFASLPPLIQAYLFPNIGENDESAWPQNRKSWQKRFLNRGKKDNAHIQATLEWMENELEI